MLVALLSSMPLRQRLNSIRTRWYRLIQNVRDNYRPELHYMRGPGPKWYAKHHGRSESGALRATAPRCALTAVDRRRFRP